VSGPASTARAWDRERLRAREEAAQSERREALVEDVIALFALTLCVGGVAFGLGAVFSAGGCV